MTETSPCEIIVGVDTHKHTHAAVAINTLGAHLGAMTIPVSTTGYRALEAWARSFGPIRAFGIEGTGCYGAGLVALPAGKRPSGLRGQSPQPSAAPSARQERSARC